MGSDLGRVSLFGMPTELLQVVSPHRSHSDTSCITSDNLPPRNYLPAFIDCFLCQCIHDLAVTGVVSTARDLYPHYVPGSNRQAVNRLDDTLEDRNIGEESATSCNQEATDDEEAPKSLISEAGEWNRTTNLRFLRRPLIGQDECPAAAVYRQQLQERHEREAQAFASLTGWNISDIRRA